MKEKPKVGQIVYSLNIGNMARNVKQKLTSITVTKVGRIYFSCDNRRQYYIKSWGEDTIYCQDSQLYESETEWKEEKESTKIIDFIQHSFRYDNNRNRLPIEELRQIEFIIKNYKLQEEKT